MKMRKIISLLLTVAIVLSFATTGFAAGVKGANENVQFKASAIMATATKGRVAIGFSIDADDLAAFRTEDDDNLDTWSYGKGIKSVEVQFNLNEAYFATDGVGAGGYQSTGVTTVEANKFNFAYVATTDGQWLTEKAFQVCYVTATLSDAMKARYNELLAENNNDVDATKAALVAELNTKTDLVTYDKAFVTTVSYPVDGVIGSGEAFYEYYTKYYSDNTGHYAPVLKTGADAPVVEDVIVNDETPVESTITVDGKQEKVKVWEDVSVSAGLVGTGKIKAVLTNTQTSETQDVALTFAQEFTGDNDVVFDVIVKFLDYANAPYVNLEIVKVTE